MKGIKTKLLIVSIIILSISLLTVFWQRSANNESKLFISKKVMKLKQNMRMKVM